MEWKLRDRIGGTDLYGKKSETHNENREIEVQNVHLFLHFIVSQDISGVYQISIFYITVKGRMTTYIAVRRSYGFEVPNQFLHSISIPSTYDEVFK